MTRKELMERLAAIMCVADRVQDPAEAEATGYEIMATRDATYRASWERQAEAVIDHLGLIVECPHER